MVGTALYLLILTPYPFKSVAQQKNDGGFVKKSGIGVCPLYLPEIIDFIP
jgi:hypothetical protein